MVFEGAKTDYRHYIGNVAIYTVKKAADGNTSEQHGYDAFGKPRQGQYDPQDLNKLASQMSERGFTQHEHLDNVDLIHMNGRVYDYNLGRSLSVDPFIQDPGNTQSINPYS